MLDGGHLNRRKVFGLELSALEVGPGESPFLVLDHIVEQVELCGPQELRVSRAQLLALFGRVARPRNELRRGSQIERLGRSANASEASVSATSAKQPTGDRDHPTAACFAI